MEFNLMSILTLVIGFFVGFLVVAVFMAIRNNKAEAKADKLILDAKREADKHKRDTLMEIKEESHRLKQEVEREIKEKKAEFKESENRLLQRESSLDKREEILQKRDATLDDKENNLLAKQKEIQEKEFKVEELLKQELEELEKIAKFSKEKAHDLIMKRVELDMAQEIAEYVKEQERVAKLEAHEKAKQIIVSSMERYSEDVANEQTVSTIDLPNDEMKGRLIGREGRNIRTIESVTGVDLIIDDTPEAIVISSFDPLRREIAKVTIETLIKDGRIHPARIEEVYDKVSRDINTKIMEIGSQTLYDLGIGKMDTDLINLIGKLKYRSSYGQNALQHSIEVANLTGLMASELGENVTLAKRAGLLHDIGKAIDFEIEGSHVEIGADLARRFGEKQDIVHAIEAHHNDVEPSSVLAVLVQAADAISAARPGARKETLDAYIKRLEKLEEIANSYKGVERTYAIQAGREVRVMVEPDQVDEATTTVLAHDIAQRIENELQYPGQVKVVVIRESRAVGIAK